MTDQEQAMWDFIKNHLELSVEESRYHPSVKVKLLLRADWKTEVISEYTFDVGERNN
jgi:metal-sulfur cluster biosynthetic enzyme